MAVVGLHDTGPSFLSVAHELLAHSYLSCVCCGGGGGGGGGGDDYGRGCGFGYGGDGGSVDEDGGGGGTVLNGPHYTAAKLKPALKEVITRRVVCFVFFFFLTSSLA